MARPASAKATAGRPVVALLTDFGTRDHYVGTMKGVVLSVCRDAQLVDISHDIPPQDIVGAAQELAASYRYFPTGTVFLVVVDPGVGSPRLGIGADAGGYRFVAPDNGVLSAVFLETPPTLVVELREQKYARAHISRTFEGRDRFAPAAAWLANGVALPSFGPPLPQPVRLEFPAPVRRQDAVHGEATRIDRFGNVVTNIDVAALESLSPPHIVRVHGTSIHGLVQTYAEAAPGALCALVGSSGRLEVAVNGGSAAERLHAYRGVAIVVCSTIPGCHDEF
jgi:S-adenosyl-L-methionine hydrolase (adenosine-forming)